MGGKAEILEKMERPVHCCSCGDAAMQAVEVMMLALIDRELIDRDHLVAELESLVLATPDIGTHQTNLTLRATLSQLANSLSGHARKDR